MSELEKIVGLLSSDALERRIAAAIVLGQLRAKGPNVTSALAATLDSGVPLLQVHALAALQAAGASRAMPKILPLLASRDEEVRRAAVSALVGIGDSVLPVLRDRIVHATGDEKRSIDAALVALGGKVALHVLLEGLTSSDANAAKAAAIAVRQQVRDADARQRRAYLDETLRFLDKARKGGASPIAVAAGVKILGYLEEDSAVDVLLSFAAPGRNEPAVRQEALIALRFLLGGSDGPPKPARLNAKTRRRYAQAVDVLVEAADDPDRALAQTALHTLSSLQIPATAVRKLVKLTRHPEFERARFALELLGRQEGAGPARALVDVLVETKDKRRAEVAAACLGPARGESQAEGDAPGLRHEALAALSSALREAKDLDRAWLLRNVLRAGARQLAPATRKALLDDSLKRLSKGDPMWEPLMSAVRDADSGVAASALRAAAQKLRRAKPEAARHALRALCRTEAATDEDRYALAVVELAMGTLDTRQTARAGDESLRLLSALQDRGVDVAARLRSDRSLDLEHLFYVGFHWAERRHPMGEALLRTVVAKGGRAKIAKMAAAKLALAVH
jgi:hypothetical protein